MLYGIAILAILDHIDGPTWAKVVAGVGIGFSFILFCVNLVKVGKALS